MKKKSLLPGYRTALAALLPIWLAMPGCGLLVAGVAVTGGALLAVNLTAEDTVRSELSDVDPARVYEVALEVVKAKGSIGSRNDSLREAEGEIEGDRVRVLVRPVPDGAVLEVRARTLADAVPAPELAREISQEILDALGLSLRPEPPPEH